MKEPSVSLAKPAGKPKAVGTLTKPPSNSVKLAQIQADKDIHRTVVRWNSITQIIITACRWGGTVGVAYFVYAAFAALAGKSTTAQIVMDVIANLEFPNALGCVTGAGGVAYGVRQKVLRKRNTAHLHPRIKELETLLDQNRTTSGLTATGDTNPEDRR